MEKRKVELFIAGCPACEPTVELVKSMICESCDLEIHNVSSADDSIYNKIKNYNIHNIPAIAVNGELLLCCKEKGITEEELIRAGIGKSLN